jgi:hypothetical protein
MVNNYYINKNNMNNYLLPQILKHKKKRPGLAVNLWVEI